jgi:hypothetical protein
MLRIQIDEARLRHDVALLALQSRAHKRALRTPWSRPMSDEQKAACRTARLTTERLILLAWSRGRTHVSVPPLELRGPGIAWDARAHAQRVAERLAPDYAAPLGVEVRS